MHVVNPTLKRPKRNKFPLQKVTEGPKAMNHEHLNFTEGQNFFKVRNPKRKVQEPKSAPLEK